MAGPGRRQRRFLLTGLTPETTVALEAKDTNLVLAAPSQHRVPSGLEPMDIGTVPVEALGSLDGRVVDPSGRPVAGATVYPHPKGAPSSFIRRADGTDAEGRFRLKVRLTSYRLEIRALGYETRSVHAPTGTRALEIVLQPVDSGSLEVLLRSSHNHLSRTTEMRVLLQGLNGLAEQVNETTELGRAGREELNRVFWPRVPVGVYEISAEGKDSVRLTTETVEITEGTNRLTLELPPPPGAKIRGRLADGQGQPVPFASLWLERKDKKSASASTVSDGNGRWSVEVAPGLYDISVSSEEHLELSRRSQRLSGGTSDLGTWRLDRGLSLGGKLLGLSPHEISRLNISAASEEIYANGHVEPDGRYRIAPLTEGYWVVDAEVRGSSLRAQGRVWVEEGSVTPPLNLEFASALAVAGRVTDNGAPLAGARVLASPQERRVSSEAFAQTNGAGSFELIGLEPGLYGLRVSLPRVGRVHGRVIRVPTDGEIEIHLATAKAAGRVVRADGAPLPGVSVRFEPIDHDQPDENGVIHSMSHQYFGWLDTDEAGEFEIGPLEEGLWRASVDLDGFPPEKISFTIADAIDVRNLEIVLEPTPGLRLSVSTEGGGQPESVRAWLHDAQGNEVAETFLQPAGAVELLWDQAPPGDWTLVVANNLVGSSGRQAVSIPGPVVRVVLPALGALHLTVVDLLEDPSSAELELFDTDGHSVARRTILRTLRRFYVNAIPPGLYQAQVTAEDGRSWGKLVEIEADQIVRETID